MNEERGKKGKERRGLRKVYRRQEKKKGVVEKRGKREGKTGKERKQRE